MRRSIAGQMPTSRWAIRRCTRHRRRWRPIAGLGDPPVGIAEGRGKFGSALEMTLENTHVVLYKAERNVAYAPEAFRGTVSFWMSLDPAEIPGQYCDPLQVTDKKYSDACIWVDFTKNDTPLTSGSASSAMPASGTQTRRRAAVSASSGGW